jgi:hypothetical protein
MVKKMCQAVLYISRRFIIIILTDTQKHKIYAYQWDTYWWNFNSQNSFNVSFSNQLYKELRNPLVNYLKLNMWKIILTVPT